MMEEVLPAVFQPLKGTNPEGPDLLTVTFMQERPLTYDSLFVSVTAADFGIEVDRVLVLPLKGEGLVLCDGEISGARSVNRPIGLFRTDRFDASSRLDPEFFYYSGKRYDGEAFEDVIRNLVIRDMAAEGLSLPEYVIPEFEQAVRQGFRLCPIAQQLIPRVHAFRSLT